MRDTLEHTHPTCTVTNYHYHDFRATVAAALAGLEKPPEVAQAMVNWASPASVALYGQMLPSNMADTADLLTRTDASRYAHLPRAVVDDDAMAAQLKSLGS